MNHRGTVTGIDIGTHETKVIIASLESRDERGFPKVIATGISETKGMRHGYINQQEEVVKSVYRAIKDAEKKVKFKIRKAFVSIGGIGLSSVTSSSSTIITRADLEITKLDIQRVHSQAEKDIPPSLILNRKIIHSIPLQYKIDGKEVLGKPEGMKGNRLEVKMHYITCLEHHVHSTIQAVEDAGVEVEDVMASPIATSLVTLSKTQKVAGSVLVNIGSETVSMAIFENNMPISLEVFSLGSSDITNDIALGLKVSIEEAEHIKLGAITGASFPRKKLEEIILYKLSSIFEMVDLHLKKINRSGLLPAGVILTGGGSNILNIEEIAKTKLRLPTRLGHIKISQDDREVIKDSRWAIAYGLCVFGSHADGGPILHSGAQVLKKTRNAIIALIKQFLP